MDFGHFQACSQERLAMAQWTDEGTNMTVTLPTVAFAVRNCPAFKHTSFETDVCTVKYGIAVRLAENFGYIPPAVGEEETSVVF